jgi:8-oxo-dGTP pyrophosphatase MutT (NUDIX family)
MDLIQGGLTDYKETTCGGAVILLGRGMIVLVRPLNGRDEWLLPKGHVEGQETTLEAAIREAQEETGAKCVEHGVGPLHTTNHTDRANKEHKTTTWHTLRAVALKSELAETLKDSAVGRRHIGIFPTTVAMARLTYEEHRDVLAVAMGAEAEG